MRNLKNYDFKVIIIISVLLAGQNAFSSCKLSTPNQLLDLIKQKHPDITFNNSREKMVKGSIEVAQERPNPEFNFQSIKGRSLEGDINKSSLSIQHTFEWGDKRNSRVNLAKKIVQEFKNRVKSANEDIVVDAVVKAYRLGQIYDLIPIYKEASDTFDKILKIKKSHKSLSPEEQVEKDTLELATNGYKLKLSKLNAEKINLSRHLSLFIGKECTINPSILPRQIDIKQTFTKNLEYKDYSNILIAKNGVDVASANLDMADSLSYPDIKVGPSVELENMGGENYQSLGVMITFDLPILNSNSGQIEKSKSALRSASINLLNIEREAVLDLESWIDKYNTFSASLKLISSRSELNRKHMQIDKLFKRGVVSTSMVIESHRQLIEFAISRFEFELGATKALWNIYKLNGSVLNKKL